MATSTTLLSLAEFQDLPDNGMRHELSEGELIEMPPPKYLQWGIHLTQVAPRRCGLVDPWTPAHCTQNAPWGARRRSAGNWATRLRFGPIKDYARAMAIAGLETWCYRQAFPGPPMANHSMLWSPESNGYPTISIRTSLTASLRFF